VWRFGVAALVSAGIMAIDLVHAQNSRFQTAPVTSKSAGPPDPALLEDLVVANRLVVDMGVMEIRGHVSVRHNGDPNRFLISRSMAPELVTVADIMEFDLDGNAIDHRGREIFSERYIHSELYRARPDVMAVIHTHAPSLILYSSSDILLRPLFGGAAFIGNKGVPAFQNGTAGGGVGSPELGKGLASSLGRAAAVLMRGHGSVVVGFSLPNVVGRLVALDTNARMQAQTLAMGAKPIYIVAREDAASSNNDYAREWAAWKRKTLRMMKVE
jgi:HCOMODA/2-hydroxy-3-carboxy-muconic semialdehyde decarboxylase